MKKLTRSVYDKYFKLTCVIEQLSNYFYLTRKDECATSLPMFYEFCNYFVNNEEYEFTKIGLTEAKKKFRKYYEDANGIHSHIPERPAYLCWEIRHNGELLDEDEIFELYMRFTCNNISPETIEEVNKDVDKEPFLFTEEQNQQVQAILKLFVNINGQFMFLKENGELDSEKIVELPYSNIPVSIQQIRNIRSILKRELKKQYTDSL